MSKEKKEILFMVAIYLFILFILSLKNIKPKTPEEILSSQNAINQKSFNYVKTNE